MINQKKKKISVEVTLEFVSVTYIFKKGQFKCSKVCPNVRVTSIYSHQFEDINSLSIDHLFVLIINKLCGIEVQVDN